MKEQFVTYEIALKFKELGFDEEVIATFDTDENNELKIFAFSVPDKGIFEEGFKREWCIKTPLWQQAIDFLKERKVLVAERWDGWEYGAYDWDDFIYTDTKEEAILKAIEICQKNHS